MSLGTKVIGGVDVSKCESLLDELTPDCISAEGDLKQCDVYIKPSAECLDSLNWEGKKIKWLDELPSYIKPYLLLAKGVNLELDKKEYGLGESVKFFQAVRIIFFAAVSHADKKLVEDTNKVLMEALVDGGSGKKVSPEFEKFVDYVNKGDLKFLAPGVTFKDNRDAALLLLRIKAVSNKDEMKEGWERKYLSEVTKYFPLTPLVPEKPH